MVASRGWWLHHIDYRLCTYLHAPYYTDAAQEESHASHHLALQACGAFVRDGLLRRRRRWRRRCGKLPCQLPPCRPPPCQPPCRPPRLRQRCTPPGRRRTRRREPNHGESGWRLVQVLSPQVAQEVHLQLRMRLEHVEHERQLDDAERMIIVRAPTRGGSSPPSFVFPGVDGVGRRRRAARRRSQSETTRRGWAAMPMPMPLRLFSLCVYSWARERASERTERTWWGRRR